MKHQHISILLLVLLCGAVGYNIHLTRKLNRYDETLSIILDNTAEAIEVGAIAANNAKEAYEMAQEARDLADEAQYQASQRQQVYYYED